MQHDLWDYVGERLPENALERVEQHLGNCASCRREAEVMRQAQDLLTDCRFQVPAPRSGWSDLQYRMEREGMISPLSGRILVGGAAQNEAHPSEARRARFAAQWNRWSLAGSMAATVLLSFTVYRLALPPTSGDDTSSEIRAENAPVVVTPAPQTEKMDAAIAKSVPMSNNGAAWSNLLANPLIVQVGGVNTPTPERPREITPRRTETPRFVVQQPKIKDEPMPPTTRGNRFRAAFAPPSVLAQGTPSEVKPERDSQIPSSNADARKDAASAKNSPTRYIMRGLTPASYKEDEGIF